MQTPTPPNIEGHTGGGQAHRHHRNVTRIAIAAAVLVGGGVYGVTKVDRGDTAPQPGIATQPTESSDSATTPPPYPEGVNLSEPGIYRKVVGVDAASGNPIHADLTFKDPGWYSGAQPVITADDESGSAGLGVFEPRALADSSGCLAGETPNADFRQAAKTAETLGRQLTKLPRSTVIQDLTSTAAFGYDAFHLRLRIDAGCPPDEAYMVGVGDTGSLGITYNAPFKAVIDFLVVDVDGTPIVAAVWHDVHAPRELVDRATRVRDSINLVPSEPTI